MVIMTLIIYSPLFIVNVIKIINKHVPIKQIFRRQLKRFLKPWITQGIRASIKTKNKLFASGDQTKYKFYRNKINHLIRISKRGSGADTGGVDRVDIHPPFFSKKKNSKCHFI